MVDSCLQLLSLPELSSQFLCCWVTAVWPHIVVEIRTWRAHAPCLPSLILQRGHVRVLQCTSVLIVCPWGSYSSNSMPFMSKITEVSLFQQKVLSEISLDEDCHRVSTAWIAFSPLESGSETRIHQPVWQRIPLGPCEEQTAPGSFAHFFPFFFWCEISWNPVCTNLLHS